MSGQIDYYNHFGPAANCTFEVCSTVDSVYGYRPSLGASFSYIILFSIATLVHIYLGFRWKTWWFMWCVLVTCAHEVIGYTGRIMLYNNPWSFAAFMINIVCITQAPIFYCAAIYVTLAQSINEFSPDLARFPPRYLYWVFIPCDVISLVLQGTGGGMAADTSGTTNVGLIITRAGLIFQVITLAGFLALFADFLVRYTKLVPWKSLGRKVQTFVVFVLLSAGLTFVRCIYRIAELKDGYRGKLFRDEPLFYVLEGALVILAVLFLCIGHPGRVFNNGASERKRSADSADSSASLSNGASAVSQNPIESKV